MVHEQTQFHNNDDDLKLCAKKQTKKKEEEENRTIARAPCLVTDELKMQEDGGKTTGTYRHIGGVWESQAGDDDDGTRSH